MYSEAAFQSNEWILQFDSLAVKLNVPSQSNVGLYYCGISGNSNNLYRVYVHYWQT